jgi:hypothetical protein
MAKEVNPTPKRVIKTEAKKADPVSGPSSTLASRKKSTSSGLTNTPQELTFTTDNLKWILISVGILILGYILMMGGKMPDYNTWDESVIYSFTRTVISPFVILCGIGLAIYSIFRHQKPSDNSAEN